jgi:prolyl-tRNA synthetase
LKLVVMGSYGIGPSRVMGTIAEVWADDKGLIWPESVAPFAVHLVVLFDKEGKVQKVADELYSNLSKKGVEVLYDDRDVGAGEKFSDSDLIGIPKRIIVSAKTLAEDSVETKDRATGKVEMVKLSEI